MKINLTLESGLEVDFTPDFDLPNESLIEKAEWILPDPVSTQTIQQYFFIKDDYDDEDF